MNQLWLLNNWLKFRHVSLPYFFKMTYFTYTEKCSFFFYNLYPFHFFSGQGVKIVFNIKLFKKFMMKDTMRCPEDYEFLALKKLVFPFFFIGGGGGCQDDEVSVPPLPHPLKTKVSELWIKLDLFERDLYDCAVTIKTPSAFGPIQLPPTSLVVMKYNVCLRWQTVKVGVAHKNQSESWYLKHASN